MHAPQVEGTCSGRYGYIVCITEMEEIGEGLIREGTGFAQVLQSVHNYIFNSIRDQVKSHAWMP